MSMTKEMGRRGFLAAGALSAAALAFGAAGCSGKRKVDPKINYLPLGSVVRLSDGVSPLLQMVVARRPISNIVRDAVTGEYRPLSLGETEPYDYAGIRFPFGIASNVGTLAGYDEIAPDSDPVEPADNGLLIAGDITCFNMVDIEEVLFCGYDDGDLETRCAAALDAAKGTPKVGIEAMVDIVKEVNASVLGKEGK